MAAVQNRSILSLSNILITLGVLALSILAYPQKSHAQMTAEKFLEFSDGQREWWLYGAVDSLALITALHTQERGNCVAAWLAEDTKAKQAAFKDALENNPTYSPGPVLFALIQKECGSLRPPGSVANSQ